MPPFSPPRPAGTAGAFAEWAFKATKQLVKLSCRTGQPGPMLARYRELLGMITAGDSAVTRNRAEKAINGILDLFPNVRLDPDRPTPHMIGAMMRTPRQLHVVFDR